jgi:tRNA-specific 2-thiouridylase
VGQRRGLGIGTGEPLYVTEIDAARNALVVGPRELLYRTECTAARLSWIAMEELSGEMPVRARIRYRHREAEARLTPLAGDRVHVLFREPQMAITPGQAIVFYEGDVVLGGGTIEDRRGAVA